MIFGERHEKCVVDLRGLDVIGATRIGPILIVDDDDDGREMLAEYFSAQGYRTIAINEPRMALTLCRDTAPPIVLVDLSLPTLDAACQLIQEIKNAEGGVSPYIIGLNGWGFVQQASRALAMGCSLVIAKPLDLHLLSAAVTVGMATNVGACCAA